MRNVMAKAILCHLLLFAAFLFSCTHETARSGVGKSLTAAELARYNDSFESLRGDLWEKIGFIRGASLRTDFKQADLLVEGGRLKIETKTGCFSSGGVTSKFFFRGDFDVQVDCDVDFLKQLPSMDQLVYFLASDMTAELEDSKLENVFLQMIKEGAGEAYISGYSLSRGKRDRCSASKIGDRFRGSLRIVRVGNLITLMYATTPGGEWQTACSFSRPANDTRINIGVRNFFERRTAIDATSPVMAQFDNFRVNAAQEITESEI
jgi:hypothetical protein